MNLAELIRTLNELSVNHDPTGQKTVYVGDGEGDQFADVGSVGYWDDGVFIEALRPWRSPEEEDD